jgi:hypothetical protein
MDDTMASWFGEISSFLFWEQWQRYWLIISNILFNDAVSI